MGKWGRRTQTTQIVDLAGKGRSAMRGGGGGGGVGGKNTEGGLCKILGSGQEQGIKQSTEDELELEG